MIGILPLQKYFHGDFSKKKILETFIWNIHHSIKSTCLLFPLPKDIIQRERTQKYGSIAIYLHSSYHTTLIEGILPLFTTFQISHSNSKNKMITVKIKSDILCAISVGNTKNFIVEHSGQKVNQEGQILNET